MSHRLIHGLGRKGDHPPNTRSESDSLLHSTPSSEIHPDWFGAGWIGGPPTAQDWRLRGLLRAVYRLAANESLIRQTVTGVRRSLRDADENPWAKSVRCNAYAGKRSSRLQFCEGSPQFRCRSALCARLPTDRLSAKDIHYSPISAKTRIRCWPVWPRLRSRR